MCQRLQRQILPPVPLAQIHIYSCRWYRWQICHRCQQHWLCTLSSEHLREFSKKIETALMGYLGAWGNKNLKWHWPFNPFQLVREFIYKSSLSFYVWPRHEKQSQIAKLVAVFMNSKCKYQNTLYRDISSTEKEGTVIHIWAYIFLQNNEIMLKKLTIQYYHK